jgi:Fe-S-cluster containining protein
MYLVHKIKAVNSVFGQLERHISNFKTKSGISCVANCGNCCNKPDLQATVLEFLPAAYNLYLSGQHESIFNHLENNCNGICVFYNPFTEGGFCSYYQYRGLVCRLFGYATRQGKYETPVQVTCKTIKRSLDPAKLYKIITKAPAITDYYMKLYGIDPGLTIEAPRSKLRGNELANSTKSIFDPLL